MSRVVEDLWERARRMGARRFWKAVPTPTNIQGRDTSAASISSDVNYGLVCGRTYFARLRDQGLTPAGLDVVEIGPGTAFGAMAYLAAFGARTSVADRWLAHWQNDYHRPYYELLADRIRGEAPRADLIDALAASGCYEGGPIAAISTGAEYLGRQFAGAFDVAFSNAVLEHVKDIHAAAHSIFDATRPGGLGYHQIDYRDHRNFAKPLQHLLYAPSVWNGISERVNWEYGTQRRPEHYRAALENAGFAILDYSVTDEASSDYLNELIPKLRAERKSPFRHTDKRDLADLGGLFVVRRPEAE